MVRIYKYIGGMVLGSVFGAVGLFVFIMLAGNALKDLLGLVASGVLPFGLVLEMVGLLVPYAVSFALPMGTLIGILLVMGRLSANSEITAFRCAGLSLVNLSGPGLLVGVLGTLLAGYINASYAPTAMASYRAILSDLVRTDPLRFIVEKTFVHDFPGYVIYAADNKDGVLSGFWIWELDDDGNALRILRAEEGQFSYDAAGDSLILQLRNGFTELRDAAAPNRLSDIQPILGFSEARIRLDLSEILGDAAPPRKFAHWTLAELWTERERMRRESLQHSPLAAERGMAEVEGGQLNYQISRRLAMAWSVFSLALLGVPLGIRASRSETYANIGLGLAVVMVYYVSLVVVGWFEGSVRVRPELLVWLPNIVCQLAGALLLWRANRR